MWSSNGFQCSVLFEEIQRVSRFGKAAWLGVTSERWMIISSSFKIGYQWHLIVGRTKWVTSTVLSEYYCWTDGKIRRSLVMMVIYVWSEWFPVSASADIEKIPFQHTSVYHYYETVVHWLGDMFSNRSFHQWSDTSTVLYHNQNHNHTVYAGLLLLNLRIYGAFSHVQSSVFDLCSWL